MKNILLILTFFSLITSCKNEIERDIVGFWDIQHSYYNGEKVINDLLTNSIDFTNEKCYLPIKEIKEREIKANEGTWEVKIDEKDRTILEITTTNKIFNRNFHITKFDKQVDEKTGYNFIEMTIKADSLKLDLIRKRDVK